jgi:hypothetical protein
MNKLINDATKIEQIEGGFLVESDSNGNRIKTFVSTSTVDLLENLFNELGPVDFASLK